MRFEQIRLMAFGPFTDVTLDMSAGREGLHLIYGPNEAGKSSALRAIHCLLYGIPARTADSFVHPYNRLRLGAVVRNRRGQWLEFIRRKGNQGTLRDADDAGSLSDSALDPFLQGVNADLFLTMFGIDHARLRKGGQEIVGGGGQIGEMLFAAGSGLKGLQQLQQRLAAQLDELYKPAAQKPRINLGLRQWRDSHAALRRQALSPDQWLTHDRELRRAQDELRELDERLREQQRQQRRLSRIRDVLPIVSRWKRVLADLQACRDVPLLPADFSERRQAALLQLQRAEQRRVDAEENLATLAQAIETLEFDEKLVAAGEAIEGLRERLGSHRKAAHDRKGLELERQAALQAAGELLKKVGREPSPEGVEPLRLPVDQSMHIQQLGTLQQALQTRRETAQREVEQLRRGLAEAAARYRPDVQPLHPGPLRERVRSIQQLGDIELRLHRLRAELESLAEDAAVRQAQLGWSGTLDELERLPVPSEPTLDRFDDEGGRLEAVQADLVRREENAMKAGQELQSKLERLERAQAVPTEDDLREARQRREQGWQWLLASWRQEAPAAAAVAPFIAAHSPATDLAEAYHRSVEEADQLSDRLRREADRVAKKAQLQADLHQQHLQLQELKRERQEVCEARQRFQQDWAALWQPLGVTPLTVREMRVWRRQQQQLAADAQQLRGRQRELQQLNEQIANARRQLEELAPQFGYELDPSDSLSSLLLRAEAQAQLLDQQRTEQENLRQRIERQQLELVGAEQRGREAEQELIRWQREWGREMARLQLPEDAAASRAITVLRHLEDALQKYHDADELQRRIEHIARDASEFAADARDMASRLAPELAPLPVETLIGELASRCETARQQRDRGRELARQQELARQRHADALKSARAAKTDLDAYCAEAQCREYAELAAVESASQQRRQWETLRQDLESQLYACGSGQSLEDLVRDVEAEGGDTEALDQRIAELHEALEIVAARRDDVLRIVERETQELSRMDGSAQAAAAAENCQELADRLTDDLHQLAVLRVASAVLREGVERYRQKNQGPVLERASRLFAELTRGAFRGLSADVNERGAPILKGLRGAEESLEVEAMSEGTSDQLYLALRLASLETWLDQHEPMPLIVDDILMAFDDDRAAAALRVLADLSYRTQVIVFTHHQHVVELAQRHVPPEALFTHTLDQLITLPAGCEDRRDVA